MASEWFFVIIKTKESHTAGAVWLFLAGIAGLRTMVFAEVLRIQRRVHVGAGAHDSPFVRLFSGRRGADSYRDDGSYA